MKIELQIITQGKSDYMFCKHCGHEIDEKSVFCPSCGKNLTAAEPVKKKKKRALPIVLIILAVFFIIGLVGSGGDSSDPVKVDEAAPSTIPTESKKDIFTVGDVVEAEFCVVNFIGVEETSGKSFNPESGNVYVLCEFEITNTSEEELSVSSMLSFSGYFDDYATDTSLLAMSASEKKQLDGSIACGKKMRGVIGFEVKEDWKELEIRYTPFVFGDEIVFSYSK